MQLTPHFADTELGVASCEQRLIDNAQYICTQLLEPIRDQFGPVSVDDGYRDPAHNLRVGGKPTSYHLFNGGQSAADIRVNGATLQMLFDWIRLTSGLPFDKIILEYSGNIPACVHIQVDSAVPPRRQAFVGGTGDSQNYTQVSVV